MSAVAFERFRKQFGATVAIDGLDLRIPEGTIYGLLGPNGSGKTTCIRAICGLLRPTSGTVRVLDADAHAARARVRPRIGYMPQQAALYEDLTARENLEFFARGLSVPEPRTRAGALLELRGSPEARRRSRLRLLGRHEAARVARLRAAARAARAAARRADGGRRPAAAPAHVGDVRGAARSRRDPDRLHQPARRGRALRPAVGPARGPAARRGAAAHPARPRPHARHAEPRRLGRDRSSSPTTSTSCRRCWRAAASTPCGSSATRSRT